MSKSKLDPIWSCKMCGQDAVHKISENIEEGKTSNHYYRCKSCMHKTEYCATESIAKFEWQKLNKDRSHCIECNKHIPDIMIYTWDCSSCLEPKCKDCCCSNCNTVNP